MTNQKFDGDGNSIERPSERGGLYKKQTKKSDPQTLIAAIRDGDAQAFADFYMGYGDSIVRFLTRFLCNVDDAKEITQETFVLLWENRQKLDPDKSLWTYTSRIARNIAVDMIQARNRLPETDIELNHYDRDLAGFADEELLAQEIEILYRDVVRRMPPQRRKIYLMHREEDLSYNEIADRLGISYNTVKFHIQAALNDIRSALSVMILLFFIN